MARRQRNDNATDIIPADVALVRAALRFHWPSGIVAMMCLMLANALHSYLVFGTVAGLTNIEGLAVLCYCAASDMLLHAYMRSVVPRDVDKLKTPAEVRRHVIVQTLQCGGLVTFFAAFWTTGTVVLLRGSNLSPVTVSVLPTLVLAVLALIIRRDIPREWPPFGPFSHPPDWVLAAVPRRRPD